MKKIFLILYVLQTITGCSTKNSVTSATELKPNIIIIFNDDQGYQDLGCYGSPNIKTPRVDQLAKEGMRFTDHYAASSVCSASRASLLTGCYPQRVGVNGVFFPNTEGGLDPKHITIAEILKTNGYATAAVGKWHLGDKPQFLPTNQGFDSYYGIPYSNDMYPAKEMKYADNCAFREDYTQVRIDDIFRKSLNENNPKELKNKVPLMRNIECVEFPCDQTTITKRYAEESLQFIKENAALKKPFFLYLANTMPHTPIFTSPEFKGRSKQGLYGDSIEEIDFFTGKILDQLKELGIEKNTIVIFTSDNGPWLTEGKNNSGSALPLFEGKFTSFDGGMRVPFIIRWPKKIPAGEICTELTSTIDILPTLAKITGAKFPETELDGKNIANLWEGKKGAKTPHNNYFLVFEGEAVRSGDWKYHKREVFQMKATARISDGPTLYNLKSDIGESVNVIDQNPEVANRLAKALDAHLERIQKVKN